MNGAGKRPKAAKCLRQDAPPPGRTRAAPPVKAPRRFVNRAGRAESTVHAWAAGRPNTRASRPAPIGGGLGGRERRRRREHLARLGTKFPADRGPQEQTLFKHGETRGHHQGARQEDIIDQMADAATIAPPPGGVWTACGGAPHTSSARSNTVCVHSRPVPK